MWTYFCFPSFRENKEQFLYLPGSLSYCKAVITSPISFNGKSCSCPSGMLFWALAHPHCHSLPSPDFSLCCTEPDPALGRSSDSLQGVSLCISQAKEVLCSIAANHLLPAFVCAIIPIYLYNFVLLSLHCPLLLLIFFQNIPPNPTFIVNSNAVL